MYPKWIWKAFALPGIGWLVAFFLVAFYAIVATSFGYSDDVGDPIPVFNPLDWNIGYFSAVFDELTPGGIYWTVFVRTFVYVILAGGLSLLIGYPVAYYVARRAKHKGLLLLLIVLPFWISYLMRMFAWINLLAEDGYASRLLAFFQIDTLFRTLGLLDEGAGWLDGQAITVILALVYGYVPFLILPVFAAVDRIYAVSGTVDGQPVSGGVARTRGLARTSRGSARFVSPDTGATGTLIASQFPNILWATAPGQLAYLDDPSLTGDVSFDRVVIMPLSVDADGSFVSAPALLTLEPIGLDGKPSGVTVRFRNSVVRGTLDGVQLSGTPRLSGELVVADLAAAVARIVNVDQAAALGLLAGVLHFDPTAPPEVIAFEMDMVLD